jgi:hypothetical protein
MKIINFFYENKVYWGIFFFITLCAMVNVVGLYFVKFPKQKSNNSISSFVNVEHRFYRVKEEMVLNAFLETINNIYLGSTIYALYDFFNADLFANSKVTIKFLNRAENVKCTKSDHLNYYSQAKYDFWYNPVFFSPVKYKVIKSRPFYTDPQLQSKYPVKIFLIENSYFSKSIYTVLCGENIFFVPSDILQKVTS